MSEQVDLSSPSAGGEPTAGELLKAARAANGIHIAALAAAIKVSVNKLELLEADRYHELPDLAFARALAQTVCRFLKIDPAPVLAKLPQSGSVAQLEHVARGLNQPFHDPGTRRDTPLLDALGRPAVWLPLLLVAASIGLWLAPPGLLGGAGDEAPAAGDVPAPVVQELSPTQSAASETVHSAPPAEPAAPAPVVMTETAAAPEPAASEATAGTQPEAAPPDGSLVLRARAQSWIEVQEAGGRILLSRVLAAGETVGLDGRFPMRLKVGNARDTEVLLRGQAVELAPYTRDNVARLELQ